jgi:uncharacterized protein YqgV (UPF0045/DUF77 family)
MRCRLLLRGLTVSDRGSGSTCNALYAVYNVPMAKKKMTVEDKIDALTGTVAVLSRQMQKGFASLETRMEKGFAAVAEGIAGVKENVVALHVQVNSIEVQLRDQKRERLTGRVEDLEEKVSGAARH